MGAEERVIERPAAWENPLPLPVPIATVRLVMRPWRVEDAAEVFGVIEGHRAAMRRWLSWPDTDCADESTCRRKLAGFGAEAAHPSGGAVLLGVFERDGGGLIGGIGLNGFDRGAHAVEIGYWVRPDRWGEGLATEACGGLVSSALRRVVDGGFGLRRVFVRCDERNMGSRRVAEKLGMRLEARRECDAWADSVDGWRTTLEFGVLAGEWDFGSDRALPGVSGSGVVVSGDGFGPRGR